MILTNWLKSVRRSRRITNVRRPADQPATWQLPTRAETLEDKTLLAVSGVLVGSELSVFADQGDDIRIQRDAATGNVEVVITNTGVSADTIPAVQTSAITTLNVFTGSDNNDIDLRPLTVSEFGVLTAVNVEAGDGDDSILGSSEFAENLRGNDGNDTIDGNDGNDTIDAGNGNDFVLGGDGDDIIDGDDGGDSIDGEAGVDSITGGDGADTIFGGLANDTIDGGNGGDFIDGGRGDDLINSMSGNDFVLGGAGLDTVFAGTGNDTVSGGDDSDQLDGQGGNDTLFGDAGDDTLQGGQRNDSLVGGDGNDFINSGTGRDTAEGNDGDDRVFGGGGNDSLDGGSGNDTVQGQGGDDTILGGGGFDSLLGGSGNDLIATVTINVSLLTSVTVGEGNPGDTVNAVVTVVLSSSPAETVTVRATTVAGTATPGQDFTAVDTTITFAPGETLKQLIIPIVSDDVQEGDEVFTVQLSQPTQAILGANQSVDVTIVNDDMVVPVSDYDVVINFTGTFTPAQMAAFQAAESRLEEIIIGDVPDIMVTGLGLVDDVVIDAQIVPIDGPFGILGQAGPRSFRPGTFIPSSGIMQFDIADIPLLEASGQFAETILHEMMHVIGVGTIWQQLGLVTGAGGADPRFTGAMATAEYNASFSNTEPDVPVANQGGPGSRDSHWRESVFTNELMTPQLNGGVPNPVSRMTIASLADLGYVVDLNVADTFPITGGATASIGEISVMPITPLELWNAGGNTVNISSTPPLQNANIVQTLTFDEVPEQQTDDLTVNGVTFDFKVGGVDSTDALYGTLTGPGIVNFLQPPFLEGDAAGVLTVSFATPVSSIQFGVARSQVVDVTNGLAVELFDVNGVSLGITNVDMRPQVLFTEAVVTLNNAVPIGSMALDFTVSDAVAGGDRFAIDNLSFDTVAIFTDSVTVFGGSGRDTIIGSGGNDILNGEAGADSILGGDGNDSITGGNDNDTLRGGRGDDTLNGGSGNDILGGGGDNDIVQWDGLGDGVDTITETAGVVTLIVQGDSSANNFVVDSSLSLLTISEGAASITASNVVGQVSVFGGAGNDTVTINTISDVRALILSIDGEDGNDTITGTGASLGKVSLTLSGGNDDDIINGTSSNDTINGNDGNDSLIGNAGDDFFDGGNGNDILRGSDGNDTLNGGLDNDTLNGDDGNDSLLGSFGNDVLNGNNDNDTLDGGFGNDNLNGSAGNDLVEGGPDEDTVLGGAGNDSLDGGTGRDTIRGQSGNDAIKGGDGNDSITGDSGNDTIDAGDGDDVIDGDSGADIIAGGDGNDTINGMGGRDTILGGDGNDNLIGGGGADRVLGEAGDDTLRGNGSTDKFNGGEGIDVLADAAPPEFDDANLQIPNAVLNALATLNGF